MEKKTINVILFNTSFIITSGLKQEIRGYHDFFYSGSADDIFQLKKLVSGEKKCVVIMYSHVHCELTSSAINAVKKSNNAAVILCLSHTDNLFFIESLLRSGASGYLSLEAGKEVFAQALKAVSNGHVFIQEKLKNVILKRLLGKSLQTLDDLEHNLSDREGSIFKLLGQGYDNSSIAKKLCLSTKTIDTHFKNIKEKLSLSTSSELKYYSVNWYQVNFNVIKGSAKSSDF